MQILPQLPETQSTDQIATAAASERALHEQAAGQAITQAQVSAI